MSSKYDDLPLADALERWERLPLNAKAEMHGMMQKSVAELNTALDIIERIYTPKQPAGGPRTPPRLRLV